MKRLIVLFALCVAGDANAETGYITVDVKGKSEDGRVWHVCSYSSDTKPLGQFEIAPDAVCPVTVEFQKS